MPYIDGEYHEPDQAVAKGRCPECGKPLGADEVESEILNHWPRGLRPEVASPEAIVRAGMMRAMHEPKEEPKK